MADDYDVVERSTRWQILCYSKSKPNRPTPVFCAEFAVAIGVLGIPPGGGSVPTQFPCVLNAPCSFATSAVALRRGGGLRSRPDAAMKNETLCKILCHNLVVLIHEMHELGIDPEFGMKRRRRRGGGLLIRDCPQPALDGMLRLLSY